MASVTINGGTDFAEGTSVSVYPRTAWGVEGITGAPSGSALAGPVTITSGVAAFSGLAASTEYIAYASSPNRYMRVRTDAATGVSSELGYAEITTPFTTTTTGGSGVQVTGLTTTVTVGVRPILVEFYTPQFYHSANAAAPSIRMLEDGVIIETGATLLPTGGGGFSTNVRCRRAPTAGSHTYRIDVFQPASPGGTINLAAGVGAPAWIAVTER